MKLFKGKMLVAALLVFSFLFSVLQRPDVALAKKKEPKIDYSLTKNIENGALSLEVKVEDESGIKSIKYAEGAHRRPFFRYSYYESQVSHVELSSAKKISFSLEVKADTAYTFYVENTRGQISHRVILTKTTKKMTENRDKTSEKGESQEKPIELSKTEQGKTETTVPDKIEPETKPKLTESEMLERFGVKNERRAVWVSYLEFSDKGYTEESFRKRATEILDETVRRKMNTVYFHVRPFSNAMYRSSYFPWSVYVSGKEGKDPGFDPLEIMVKEAHKRKIKLHAFINPYRVNTAKKFEKMDEDEENYKWGNPAYRWLNDDDDENDRNVLKHDNMYYYNPSKPEVIDLIVNGVEEIVTNYKVDGVIFDDYFYPNLGKGFEKNFDAKEYKEYVDGFNKKEGKLPLSIVEWRRENINEMVRRVYQAVKKAGKKKEFGISPAGNIENLRSNLSYYVDIDRWGREDGFVDYLEPQLYWGFKNKSVPFRKAISDWQNIVSNPKTKLYIALPIYRIKDKPETEWVDNKYLLGNMLRYQRTQRVEGFSLFRYDYMLDSFLKKAEEREGRDDFFELLK